MIALSGPRWRCGIALALVVLALTLGYLSVISPLRARYETYKDRTAQLQERLRRFNGVIAARPALEKQLAEMGQREATRVAYLNRASPALASAELQEKVKQVVESSGGTLTSTQILPPQGKEGRVTIRVQMNGGIEVLEQALYALESGQPYLFVDNVSVRVRPTGARRRTFGNRLLPGGGDMLDVSFDLSGYTRSERL